MQFAFPRHYFLHCQPAARLASASKSLTSPKVAAGHHFSASRVHSALHRSCLQSPVQATHSSSSGRQTHRAPGSGRHSNLENGHHSVSTAAAPAAAEAPTQASVRNDNPGDGGAHKQLAALFQEAISKAYPDLSVPALIAPTNQPEHGDYQCNNAMSLFGRLKGKPGAPKNPRAVGEAILASLPENSILEGTPSLAGPGFINVRLRKQWMAGQLQDMLQKGGPKAWAPKLPYKVCSLDFSSPNVAKEMHVGHLRSTIIGDTLACTLEFCGVHVVRINHVGDWGTQFGMLIQHISETHEGGLEAIGSADVSDLEVLYKASKKHFDDDPEFKKRAQAAVKQLQGGDPLFLKAWEHICNASRKEFQAIYDRLGVTNIWRGESFYNPLLAPLVEEMERAGISEDSEGAKVIWCPGIKHPYMIRKSDGGFGYATTDLAAIRHRVQEDKADWLIYVTDAGQASHFQLVYASARKAGILPKDAKQPPRVDHVGFGLVLSADRKRIATRSAKKSVLLVELLEEAKRRCTATIKERRPEISDEELDRASSAMGYGAVKYADLKNNRMTNYTFSFDDMLDLKGNTAVYLLYAHARIASIIARVGKDPEQLVGTAQISLDDPAEVSLALHLLKFPEAIEAVVADLLPNRLTEYIYNLADHFSGFYTNCQVADSEQEDSRLLLCHATAVVMRQVLRILGITPLNRI